MDMFHRHRQANQHDLATAVLERALCIPEYRPEALVWKGIAALPDTPGLAFVYFGNAANALPDRADIHALVGRSLIAQNHFEFATRYLTTAWQSQPNDITLRMALWQARSRSEIPTELRRMIMAHLPEIQTGNELAQVLKLLTEQCDGPRTVGVARYAPDLLAIHGWAVDLDNPQAPAPLQIEANGMKIDALASSPHALLTAAGLPTSHGGFRVNVPNPIAAVHMRFADGTNLQGSPVFAKPPFVPAAAAGGGGIQQPVDVLIPVYNGLDETLDCINSALNARKLNRTAHRIVVIEDQTPVPALAKALKVLAGKGKITLVNNPVNLGFIRSMNRAMAISPNKDVVWLNADTRVHGAWLDRLRQVAYSQDDIASVTPFTNNGELMSFPRSQFSHAMPSAAEHAELDNLACHTASPPIDIETGCGFCLYIKRAALDQVGYLDEVHLSRGYGEETDWCLRARTMGWKHVGAPNVFVAHQGGISFGAEKAMRVVHNNAILRQRYPDASARYKAFCMLDPIKPAREALQRARIAQLAEGISVNESSQWPARGKKRLHVYGSLDTDAEFSLTWHHDTHRTWVTLQAPLPALALILDFELPRDFASLVDALRLLPQEEIVFEQLARCPLELCRLPALLGTPYRIICRDERLLEADDLHDWQRFAQQAACVQLPWRALQEPFASALPDIQLTVAASAPLPYQHSETPRLLLIGDSLDSPDIGRQWLALVRHIACNQLPITLVSVADTPWFKALQAVGSTLLLPEAQGLTFAQRAESAGCDGVLSLSEAPGADWRGPILAAELNLPLYAKPGPLADELGAYPINSIPSLSQA